MASLSKAKKKLWALGDLAARSLVVRRVAQRSRLFSFFDGGMHRGPARRFARGPWSALVLGAPNTEYAAIDRAFPEFEKLFAAKRVGTGMLRRELSVSSQPAVLAWGASGGGQLAALRGRDDAACPVFHISRGPIDIGHGADAALGYVLDWTGHYANSRRTSDLEATLNHFPFQTHPRMLDRIDALIDEQFPQSDLTGPVLVACQHRSDPPAVFAGRTHMEAADLVELARSEHPGAKIVLLPVCPSGKARDAYLAQLGKLGAVAAPDAWPGLMARAARLYTASASQGFTALLHGVPVTTVGPSFYAGWGLTDDRKPVPRRLRSLTRRELAAAVLVLYSRFLRRGELVSLVSQPEAEA